MVSVFFFFWLCCIGCEILVPRPRVKAEPPTAEARSSSIGEPEMSIVSVVKCLLVCLSTL